MCKECVKLLLIVYTVHTLIFCWVQQKSEVAGLVHVSHSAAPERFGLVLAEKGEGQLGREFGISPFRPFTGV